MTCTIMTDKECFTEGGECTFIKQMIEESSHIDNHHILYTSLIGRKHSIKPLLAFLKDTGFPYVGTFTLYQGRTLRWCLCWTHNPSIGNHIVGNPLHYKVFARKRFERQTQKITMTFQEEEEVVITRLKEFLSRCEVHVRSVL